METNKGIVPTPKVPKKNEYIAPSIIHEQLAKIHDRIHSIGAQDNQNTKDLGLRLLALEKKLSEIESYIKKPWYKR